MAVDADWRSSAPAGRDGDWLLLVAAPLAGGLLFVSIVGLVVFVSLARKKRSLNGTYSPHKQELQAPRLELDYMMKPPNEERLI